MPIYEKTVKALKAGVTRMTVNAAMKNIGSWDAALAKVEAAGADPVFGCLGLSMRPSWGRPHPVFRLRRNRRGALVPQ